MKQHYTKEFLEKVVKESSSIAQVLKKLNLRVNGGNHGQTKFWIQKHEIDSSHFLGQGHNRGKESPRRLDVASVLVKDRNCGLKESIKRLRRAMLQSGIEYKCRDCSLQDEWNKRILRLQVHHINGDNLDNRKENVCFLCPNCHSQTENFGAKNIAGIDQLAGVVRPRI